MNSLSAILSLILKNKPGLQKKYPIKTIGVFGSVARGDFNEESDIDILVEFEKPIGIEFIDLANELESILQQKVDLISRSGIKPKYFKIIEKDLHYV
jgi:predicted nucleotidyltransferase